MYSHRKIKKQAEDWYDEFEFEILVTKTTEDQTKLLFKTCYLDAWESGFNAGILKMEREEALETFCRQKWEGRLTM
jgi:hypothetical protein